MASIDLTDDRPPPAPTSPSDARWELAQEFLHGHGIEIGALHLAMRLPDGASVSYVDRMSVQDLRAHYPELATLDLAPVDIVDDGERLLTIAPESVDFIVANHFLEHCEDPIRTIETHLGKLRPGGVLFYAVPDKRFTFDFRRERTPLQHHIDDHEHGPERSRSEHYLQWASLVYEGTGPPSPEQAQAYAHQLEAENYSIHFHVWTESDLVALMLHIQERLGNFEIEVVRRHGIENIIVLRKHGTPSQANLAQAPAVQAVEPAAAIPALHLEQTRDRIALASLRLRLDVHPDAAHWSIDADGAPGRGLVQSAGARVEVPLTLRDPVRLEARVRLLRHDWRDGTRSVHASVFAVAQDGRRQMLWTGELAAAPEGGREEGLPVECTVPADSGALVLDVETRGVRDPGSVARVVWLEPALRDPSAPADDPPARMPSRPPVAPRDDDEPLFSVLMPVHDPPLHMLAEAVESVRRQTFAAWELCLVDDGSCKPEIVAALQMYAGHDQRIRLSRREQPGGISDATNAALDIARGPFVALLDHDDVITPNALELMAEAILDDPEPDVVYSDEAILTEDRLTGRMIKPGWSPESLCSLMYTCHLGVYRRALVQEIGGLRSQFDGCQDYDLVLRLAERTHRFAHVPAQLYHWRAHAGSTAGGAHAKPYAFLAQPRAIREHLQRRGIDAKVELGALPGMHRIVHRVDPAARAALVTATADASALARAAATWVEQPHNAWELVVALPQAAVAEARSALTALGVVGNRLRIVRADPGQNPAHALAAAATAAVEAGAEHLVLMQEPCMGLTRDWLTTLLGYSATPGVAATGALVLAPGGRVADAGLAFPQGIALPLTHGFSGAGAQSVAMNVSAVSGVLCTARSAFTALGGLAAEWGTLALAEFCVRAAERGGRSVIAPDARMQLVAGDLADNDLPGLWRLRRRWLRTHAGDPLYNPNFRSDRGDFTARVPL